MTIDKEAGRELKLFIDNDSQLYNSGFVPITKNLTKKKQKGTYDSSKAPKAFKYLVEDGAKKYAREFGGTWNTMFTPETRRWLEKEYADEFEEEYKYGNYS